MSKWGSGQNIALRLVLCTAMLTGTTALAVWTERLVTGPPAGIYRMAYDPVREVTVLCCAEGSDPERSATWQWDGQEWTLVDEQGPPVRNSAGMAYDERRQVIVLFGGWYDGENFGDTWEWDGLAWQQVASEGPAPRGYARTVYDASRGVVVLFGGNSLEETFGDTWEWDGSQWEMVASDGPSARTVHVMAYDSAREVTVLYGGFAVDPDAGDDTWEWNGYQWRQVVETGPGVDWPEMVYDPTRRGTVLFGVGGETWQWDGRAWTMLDEAGPGRVLAAMSFDTQRGVAVLHGGLLDIDTWEYAVPGIRLDCSSLSACPGGTFVHRTVAHNHADEILAVDVRVLSGPGVPIGQQLFAEFVGEGDSVRVLREARTPGGLPEVCPTAVAIEASLQTAAGEVLASDLCEVEFAPPE